MAALNALLQLITSAVVAAGLLMGLLVIDAQVAVAGAILFGGAYGLLEITARRELRHNGQKKRSPRLPASSSKRRRKGLVSFAMCWSMAANPPIRRFTAKRIAPNANFRRKTVS